MFLPEDYHPKKRTAKRVFIYKTDIDTPQDVAQLEPILNKCSNIVRWSVDTEDVDKVLRIESTADNADETVRSVTTAGYRCEELDN